MRGAAESCDLSVRLHVTIHESNLYHQNVSLKKTLAPSRIRVPEARFCEVAFREAKHKCVHPSSEIVP